MSGITADDRKEITAMIVEHISPINKQMDELLALTKKSFDLQRESSDHLKDFQSDYREDKAFDKSWKENLDKRVCYVEDKTEALPTPKRRQQDREDEKAKNEKRSSVIQIIGISATILTVIGGFMVWSINTIEKKFETKMSAYLKENNIKQEKQEVKR